MFKLTNNEPVMLGAALQITQALIKVSRDEDGQGQAALRELLELARGQRQAISKEYFKLLQTPNTKETHLTRIAGAHEDTEQHKYKPDAIFEINGATSRDIILCALQETGGQISVINPLRTDCLNQPHANDQRIIQENGGGYLTRDANQLIMPALAASIKISVALNTALTRVTELSKARTLSDGDPEILEPRISQISSMLNGDTLPAQLAPITINSKHTHKLLAEANASVEAYNASLGVPTKGKGTAAPAVETELALHA